MATWVEDITTALNNLSGIAPLSSIYAEVKRIRPLPHPVAIEATIRGAIERNSADSQAHLGGKDLFFSVHGLGAGIWGLRSSIPLTRLANDLEPLPVGTMQPEKREQVIYRILREGSLAKKIKLLHENQCQLCLTRINLSGESYAEAHHIKPLGSPHFGPDIAENIVIVCPNCHVKLDYFSIELDPKELVKKNGHTIGQGYIDYHNAQILKSCEE